MDRAVRTRHPTGELTPTPSVEPGENRAEQPEPHPGDPQLRYQAYRGSETATEVRLEASNLETGQTEYLMSPRS